MTATAPVLPGIRRRADATPGTLGNPVGTPSPHVVHSPAFVGYPAENRLRELAATASACGLVLALVDPPEAEQRRARRYAIYVQPALFGGVDVVRAWGRLDAVHRPRRLVTHHAGEADAEAAVAAVIARRLRRGYQSAR